MRAFWMHHPARDTATLYVIEEWSAGEEPDGHGNVEVVPAHRRALTVWDGVLGWQRIPEGAEAPALLEVTRITAAAISAAVVTAELSEDLEGPVELLVEALLGRLRELKLG